MLEITADCFSSLALPVPIQRSHTNLLASTQFLQSPSGTFQIVPPVFMKSSVLGEEATPVPSEERITMHLIQAGVPSLLISSLPQRSDQVTIAILRALKNVSLASCFHDTLSVREIVSVAALLRRQHPWIIACTAAFLAHVCSSRYLPVSSILLMAPERIDLSAPTASRLPEQILRQREVLVPLRTIQNALLADTMDLLLDRMSLSSAVDVSGNGLWHRSRGYLFQALAEVSYENEAASRYLHQQRPVVHDLLRLVQTTQEAPRTEVFAIKILTNIYRTCYFHDLASVAHVARMLLIPSLLRVFRSAESGAEGCFLREESAMTMARLIEYDTNLQAAAIEAGAVDMVVDYLQQTAPAPIVRSASSLGSIRTTWQVERVWVACLLLLASACCQSPEARSVVARHVHTIVPFLSHSQAAVRSASCRVVQSLSRSLKQLRTSLLDESVAAPLIALLSDSSTDVKINASAAVCNLVLAFSACRSESLSHGGINKLAQLTRSPRVELRCNAIWSLRNLVYNAEEDVKREVLEEVGKATWEALLTDTHEEIQVQTMILLRNMVCKGCTLLLDSPYLDCKQILLNKLAVNNVEMRRQCLYVICHICAEDKHRLFGMDPALLEHVSYGLTHEDENMRMVAVLCLINLTRCSMDQTSTQERRSRLREFGFLKSLTEMSAKETAGGALAEQINTCLRQLNEESSLSPMEEF